MMAAVENKPLMFESSILGFMGLNYELIEISFMFLFKKMLGGKGTLAS